MDPILHTVIALAVTYIAYRIGRRSGLADGIANTINYLTNYDVLTDEDIRKANERFEHERRGR